MSLKAFHIVFVTASVLLALGVGAWCLSNYFSPEGARRDLYGAIASFAAAVLFVVYGRYFLKKVKNISYL